MIRAAPFAAVITLTLGCTAGPVAQAGIGGGDAPVANAEVRTANAELIGRIEALVAAFDAGAGIWIADPAVGVSLYEVDSDDPVITGSLYKLAVMLHVEVLVEGRELTYADTLDVTDQDVTAEGSFVHPGTTLTIDEALELMITRSDNGSALALWRTFGPQTINTTLARHGIEGFRLDETGLEENVATPRAIGAFFVRLMQRQLVSRAASERMLARLERQAIDDRLTALLPQGARAAHKTGDLPGLFHDAGILFTPAGPRVVVVMTWDASEEAADEFIARVGQAVYESAR